MTETKGWMVAPDAPLTGKSMNIIYRTEQDALDAARALGKTEVVEVDMSTKWSQLRRITIF